MIIKNKNLMNEFFIKYTKTLKVSDILCLTGDLGVGKTYITNIIGKTLGVKEDIVSPTFNILKIYKTNNKKIKYLNHFDVYRLKSRDELLDIGFFEYIYEKNSLTIIEWADLIRDSIPDSAIWINIKSLRNEEREITF